VPSTLGKLGGKYTGYLSGLEASKPFPAMTFETMKLVPEHPFQVQKIRVAFAKGEGPARIRLMHTFGRSYPGAFPNLKSESADLLPPQSLEVKSPDPETWIELDVSQHGVFLEPTQHYMLVYEHQGAVPNLALEEVVKGEFSRALLFVPTSVEAYGVPGNYRLELAGYHFCAWTESERWFGHQTKTPFADLSSAGVTVVDLNGDGHEDLVTAGPKAFLGDGKGGFGATSFDPFQAAPGATLLAFADLDNDGDRDAFAGYYVSRDGDGDGYEVGGTGPIDCDDTDPKVHPGASEASDSKDNDCDRIADDGKSTADGDGDGKSIAEGDCDDTRKDVYPGAPELLDGRDNDCDKQTDEDFTHRILLNDGSGHFTVAPAQGGVAALEPTTVAAFGDGNADGKLDLYYGNWLVTYPYDPAVPDRYLEGMGDGTFVDAQAKAGLVLATPYSPYGVAWTDFNNDGLPDLYVSNYHMYPNQLWKNLGGGVFVDVAVKAGVAYDEVPGPNTKLPGGHSYNAAFGDLDNDGDLDLFLCNLAHPRVQPWSDPSALLVSRGAPEWSFENRTQASGFSYDEGDVGAAFGDYDNDGDLDLAIASLYTGHYAKLYRNDGAKGFVDITYEAGVAVHDAVTVTWADVDEDGALDLLIADRDGVAPNVHLFLNRVGKKGGTYVALDLRGSTTNRDAAGARVMLRTGSTTRIREVPGGGGNPQLPHTLHVGLGGAGTIDELTVRWVGGATETITGAEPGGRYRIVEGSGKAVKP
jgi:hypothetical protein